MGGVSQEFMQSDDIPGDLNTYTGERGKEVQADAVGDILYRDVTLGEAHPYSYNSEGFKDFIGIHINWNELQISYTKKVYNNNARKVGHK